MKVVSAHIFIQPMRVRVSIDVPGLGVVEVDGCLSDETLDRLKAESITSLRAKLGRPEPTLPAPEKEK